MSAWYEARRPRRFLDGCCGIGGISAGLAAGGNEVWGVDNNLRLRDDYLRSGAAEFVCADILDVLADVSFMARFDAAHVSPPCQAYSKMSHCRPGLASQYPRLIKPCRDLLARYDMPSAVENVVSALARSEMGSPVILCMWNHFGREFYRHRLVDGGGGLVLTPPLPFPGDLAHACDGSRLGRGQVGRIDRECGLPHPVPTARAGHWVPGMFVSVAGHERKEPVRRVMEIPWARNRDDVKEAVPPYVGAWLAEQFGAHLAG